MKSMVTRTLALLVVVKVACADEFYNRLPGYGCNKFQAKNLGKSFANAEECGQASLVDPACSGTEIMWSRYSYSWGCRCCLPKPSDAPDEEVYTPNSNWNTYDYNGVCPKGEVQVVVEINTDYFPGEISWKVENQCGKTDGNTKGGPYTKALQTERTEFCVPKGQYTFIIEDWYGDGVCCEYGGGSYKVTYDGTEVTKGDSFGKQSDATFGDACPAKQTKLRLTGYGCNNFQAKNLGTSFADPIQCGDAARKDPACTGDEIMWSKYSYSWGCRCCKPKPAGDDASVYTPNHNWHTYRYDP